MNWDDGLRRMQAAGLDPVEEVYVDNYGNTLPLERPEFRNRFFRCARGVIRCNGLRIEAFLFPSEGDLQEFIEVMGADPWWVAHQNAVFHFPVSDPAIVDDILEAITGAAN